MVDWGLRNGKGSLLECAEGKITLEGALEDIWLEFVCGKKELLGICCWEGSGHGFFFGSY